MKIIISFYLIHVRTILDNNDNEKTRKTNNLFSVFESEKETHKRTQQRRMSNLIIIFGDSIGQIIIRQI